MTVENLRDTIQPKSDQLNADDLIAGPINITITSVRRGNAEQPVGIEWEGGACRSKCSVCMVAGSTMSA